MEEGRFGIQRLCVYITMGHTWTLFQSLLVLFLVLSRIHYGESVENGGDRIRTSPTDGTGEDVNGQSGDSYSSVGQKVPNDGGAKDGTATDSSGDDRELEIFQKLFLQKRMQQQQAIQGIFDKYNYEQQYKLVDMLFDRMQEILAQSRQKLTESGYEAGMPFPTDEERKEGLSLLLENLAFFADITLRLPDITHSLFNKKKTLRDVVHWGATFTEKLGFLDEVHDKLLNLMSQELRLIKRDPNYVNPFKQQEVTPEPVAPKKKKEKKQRKKGPRISRAEL